MKIRFLHLSLLIFIAVLAGCSSNDELEGSAEEVYFEMAESAMNVGNWERAIDIFQQLESQYPFGQYAAQSQLELIFAYYRNGEPEAARATADRFIRLYPDHENIDYAYYMKGMSFYSEDQRLLGRWVPTDPSKRDPGKARESFTDFSQLLTRYPNSPYAADARARMIYLRNLLAAYEIHVAEFYIRRQAFLSALNRARYVVENYQGAPAIPRALEITIEMYMRLGLEDLAQQSLDILKLNYPGSEQLDDEGNFIVSTQITDPSLIYSVTFGLLGSNKKDTPLAPARRPSRMQSEFQVNDQVEEQDRSLLNVVTLGLLGEDGQNSAETLPQEDQQEDAAEQ